MTETDPLQKEYSKKIEDNGEIMFIGSNNRDNFNEHAETHFTYLIEQGLTPSMVVLDVGCGKGFMVYDFKKAKRVFNWHLEEKVIHNIFIPFLE